MVERRRLWIGIKNVKLMKVRCRLHSSEEGAFHGIVLDLAEVEDDGSADEMWIES